jgi:ubiquinone/menaquinone biosynthesis C-methylase UbiE
MPVSLPLQPRAVKLSPADTRDAFFSDFYLRAFADDGDDPAAAEQALAAVRLAGAPEAADVLDVPCGFGRHSLPLARAGHRVVGVDRSQALLDEAARRAGSEASPRYVQADYRELPLREQSFDVALNLFSSLGYLGDEEDTRALAEIGRVLKPGGRLVIDIAHRDQLVRGFRENEWQLLGRGRLLLQQYTFDPVDGVVQMTQTLVPADGPRESRTLSLRVYSATELVGMLARAGFEESKCYGDLDGGAFGLGTRLVVVARR